MKPKCQSAKRTGIFLGFRLVFKPAGARLFCVYRTRLRPKKRSTTMLRPPGKKSSPASPAARSLPIKKKAYSITLGRKAIIETSWKEPCSRPIRNNTLHEAKANDNPSYSIRMRLLSLHALVCGLLQVGYGYAAAPDYCFTQCSDDGRV